jgi:hypothetical protein
MALFNERFSEVIAPIGKVRQNGSSPTNSGWLSVKEYERTVVLIDPLSIGTNIAVQVNIATDANGSNIVSNFAHITTLTSVPGHPAIIEILGTQLASPSGAPATGYSYIEVVATPSGTVIADILILGCSPKQAAVDQSLYQEIVAFTDS